MVRQSPPTSIPPSSPGLMISLSKPPRLQMLTIDFQCVNGLSQQEIILNLLTQVYPNTYNLLTWFYKKDCKWIYLIQCVWSQMKAQYVNEWDEYKDLKLNESCILNIFLNDNRWNSSCLNLIELIYKWSWKTSRYWLSVRKRIVVNCKRLTVYSGQSYCWAKF